MSFVSAFARVNHHMHLHISCKALWPVPLASDLCYLVIPAHRFLPLTARVDDFFTPATAHFIPFLQNEYSVNTIHLNTGLALPLPSLAPFRVALPSSFFSSIFPLSVW